MFQSFDEAIVAVKGKEDSPANIANTNVMGSWNYFTKVKLKEIVVMLQPNSTEIFEGKVKKYDIRASGTHKWEELLAGLTCLEALSVDAERVECSILRARYLILSKLGYVSGYYLRLEIFEEKYGEMLILAYGLSEKGAMAFRVDREKIFDLANYCDKHAEQEDLINLEIQSIAYIFSDRLEVRPSRGWKSFLRNGELPLHRDTQLRVRKRQGPGRFLGRRVIHVHGVTLICSMYDLDNDINAHELRLVLFDPLHSHTVEYRLSPMER